MIRLSPTPRGWWVYCLVAGGGDALTGFLLMVAPELVLRLMGIAPPMELVHLRFIGAFVTGVGLSYGLPFLASDDTSRRVRLLAVFDTSALIRFLVGAFVFIALIQGDLARAWSTVAVTDLALASFQVLSRRRLLPSETLGDVA